MEVLSVRVVAERERVCVAVGVAGEGERSRNLCWILIGDLGRMLIGAKGDMVGSVPSSTTGWSSWRTRGVFGVVGGPG